MHGNVKRKNFIWERIIQTRFSSLLVFLRYMAFSQQLVVHRHREHKAEATELSGGSKGLCFECFAVPVSP